MVHINGELGARPKVAVSVPPYFDIALVRSNPFSYDPRATKIARSLSKKYRVMVLGWDREGRYRSYEVVNSRIYVKRLKLAGPYSKPKLLLYFPVYWVWVLCNLLAYKPRIIHACDLDSLAPSCLSRLGVRAKLVFDCFDRYAMAFIPPRYRILCTLVNRLEEILARNVDALITVSKERLLTFGNYKPTRNEVVMNCPEDIKNGVDQVRRSGFPDFFTLVYAGSIVSGRGLELLDGLIRELKYVRLVLAGRILDDIINQLLQQKSNTLAC